MNKIMKKILEFSPLLIVALIIAILIGTLSPLTSKDSDKVIITSSTLTEVIAVSNISTAKYIHNGIAQATIEGKFDGYIMYYAVVKPNVDFSEITFEIDDEAKTVKPIIPQDFNFEVEILEEKGFHTSPQKNDLTAKDVYYICEKDAQDSARQNVELMSVARSNLGSTIKALLEPLLNSSGYTIILE